MLIRKIIVENVLSFLDPTEMLFDGKISIIIGPNGGGKTNLLDIINTMLRRYLFVTPYFEKRVDGDLSESWHPLHTNHLERLIFNKHSAGKQRRQLVEIQIEVSQEDLDNMRSIQSENPELQASIKRNFTPNPWKNCSSWDIANISANSLMTYTWTEGKLQSAKNTAEQHFLEYLQLLEFDNTIRHEAGKDNLKISTLYLPTSRSANNFQSSVSLASYNDTAQKQSIDATSSKSTPSIVLLAVSRLAQKYRLLQENENISAKKAFLDDPSIIALTTNLKELGYKWELQTVNSLSNQYEIILNKNETPFPASAASSGERELLTYLFAIYALNVKDALILIDEPELHLHPQWQRSLFSIFEKLSEKTGNQFVLATHSPTFISPASIQYVSRIYMENQQSNVVRLKPPDLPNSKHLFNIINSQNNEIIFFSNKVILVEGLSDRIFFKKVLEIVSDIYGITHEPMVEIVSVGGKGLFPAYEKVLKACHVNYSIIADLDYIEQIGSGGVKTLFRIDNREIKKDVIDNINSRDGDTLVDCIEEALKSGSWANTQEVWRYIKSRRRRLKSGLTELEKTLLIQDIESFYSKNIYILRNGPLETYLPEGFKSKDIEKLLFFTESSTFWEDLPPEGKTEIEMIAKALLK